MSRWTTNHTGEFFSKQKRTNELDKDMQETIDKVKLYDQKQERAIMENNYDSTADTLKHIKKVNKYLINAAMELLKRAQVHDDSKLGPNEKPFFDEETPKLAGLTYGSDEYSESLKRLGPALDHHYANNSHHPQHFPNGIDGMNLFDIIEMYLDWQAASERHTNGNLIRSLSINAERFKMSPQLVKIFMNTYEYLLPF
jgi:hypothetical protein